MLHDDWAQSWRERFDYVVRSKSSSTSEMTTRALRSWADWLTPGGRCSCRPAHSGQVGVDDEQWPLSPHERGALTALLATASTSST